MRSRTTVVLVAVLALAGCGNSRSGDEKQIRATVQGFLRGYAAGDGNKVCSLLTSRAQRDLLGAQTPAACEPIVRRLTKNAKAGDRRELRTAVVRRVEFKSDTVANAFVRFSTFDAPAGPLRVVKRGDRWLIAGAPPVS